MGSIATKNKIENLEDEREDLFQVYLTDKCGEQDCITNMKMAISVLYFNESRQTKEKFASIYALMKGATKLKRFNKE